MSQQQPLSPVPTSRPALRRSATDRVIAGVCGGLAQHLEVDATVLRLLMVVAFFVTGGAITLAYVAAILLMASPSGQPGLLTRSH
ncbi:MAG TPA: PspC domain-containing protein [Nocardioidaceae bacterium]|nr:PspC domain-containing protein [Nocardioidaceae bacterium]